MAAYDAALTIFREFVIELLTNQTYLGVGRGKLDRVQFRSPRLVARASAILYHRFMQIAFQDEFGHVGPFISRTDRRHNTSPVFGLAGYVLPHNQVRHFATFFFQLKSFMLAHELKSCGVHPATWEKKGSELISTKNVEKYAGVREGISRLLLELYKCNGKIVYYGREKYKSPEDANASGLYTTVLSHSIRAIDRYCGNSRNNFMLILDQHSNRLALLESATRTMFGNQPARWLVEPPFQVESHLYQTVQAADWIATLVGRIEAFRARPTEYADWEWAQRLYGRKVQLLATHSTMWRPKPPKAETDDSASAEK